MASLVLIVQFSIGSVLSAMTISKFLSFFFLLLTLGVHAREDYSSHFVCVSLCVCVCHSTTALEDNDLPGSETM